MNWDESIPIITLWMPWANWVMLGWKVIETRTHRRFASLQGKRIGIHASTKWDESALSAARPYLTYDQYERTEKFLRIGGAILGTVGCSAFRELNPWDDKFALIECDTKRYGNVLFDPQRIEAIPCRGHQGIWYYKTGDR